jgi:outer membrane immunogenic protein
MKKHLFASVAILAIAAASSAGAADLPMKARAPYVPPAPVFTWTGCYVGGHVGYGWSKPKFRDHNGVSSDLIDSSELGRSVGGKSNGGIFGGQIGCDYQFNGNFVVGIVGSASGASMTGSFINPFSETFSPISAKTNWLADISGRIGYAFGDTLLYVKGGAAWANTDYHVVSFGDSSFGGTTTGALVGVGFEHYILPNWTVFAEYNHYFFNSKTFTAIGEFNGNLVDVKQDIDVVKVGVNWRFNSLSAPVTARY